VKTQITLGISRVELHKKYRNQSTTVIKNTSFTTKEPIQQIKKNKTISIKAHLISKLGHYQIIVARWFKFNKQTARLMNQSRSTLNKVTKNF